MPRSYVRRNLRGQWSEEDLQNAVGDILNGRGSVREISRIYKVPVRTLMRKKESGNLTKVPLGRKSCLTYEQETSLSRYIVNMASHGFALSARDIKKLRILLLSNKIFLILSIMRKNGRTGLVSVIYEKTS